MNFFIFQKYTRLLILVTIIFIITGCDSSPEPEDTAFLYLEKWQQSDYDAMYDLLLPDTQLKVPRDEFVSRYDNIYSGIGLKNFHFSLKENLLVEEEEDKALFPLETIFTTSLVGEIPVNFELPLEMVEEEWFVDWSPALIFPQMEEGDTIRVYRDFPSRGEIFDRQRNLLAGKGEVIEVGVVPGKIIDEERLLTVLSEELGLSQQEIKKEYTQSWVRDDWFVPLKKISINTSPEVRQRLLSPGGVLLNRTTIRTYPGAEVMAQTLGYISEIDANELENMREKGYRSGDIVGKTGLEGALEERLTGIIGFKISILDENKNEKEVIAQTLSQDGEYINLTLDLSLARLIQKALGEVRGTGIALDPNTGEVLAIVSNPSYDPNLFTLGITLKEWNSLSEDSGKPFLNRSLRSTYPPGSTFKPFTALAAMEKGTLNPYEKVSLPENTWQHDPSWGSYQIRRVSRPAGPVNLIDAMKWSDNIYFAKTALNLGEEAFISFLEDLGFGKNILFPLSVAGSKISNSGRIDRDILLADSGYGQGEMETTPLHMTLLYAYLATGEMPAPILFREDSPQQWLSPNASEEHLEIIRNSLIAVINDPTGTASLARIPGNTIAGKTGTSQLGGGREVGWFTAYAPAQNPQIVLTIVTEEEPPEVKLRIAREILASYLNQRPY